MVAVDIGEELHEKVAIGEGFGGDFGRLEVFELVEELLDGLDGVAWHSMKWGDNYEGDVLKGSFRRW